MEQLNKVELKGIVGNVRYQQVAEVGVSRFYLATNHAYKDKEGNAVVETQWHNVVYYDHDLTPIVHKGDKLHVSGRIRYQKYIDIEGRDSRATEILADNVSLITD